MRDPYRTARMTARLLPLVLLLCSNVFMTFAWYGHLKYRSTAYSVVQLKTIQEILTLLVFAGFSAWYLGQPLKWNHYAAFALIVGAAFLMFKE